MQTAFLVLVILGLMVSGVSANAADAQLRHLNAPAVRDSNITANQTRPRLRLSPTHLEDSTEVDRQFHSAVHRRAGEPNSATIQSLPSPVPVNAIAVRKPSNTAVEPLPPLRLNATTVRNILAAVDSSPPALRLKATAMIGSTAESDEAWKRPAAVGLRITSCGDQPSNGGCLWRTASALALQQGAVGDLSSATVQKTLEAAMQCRDRGSQWCEAPDSAQDLDRYQLDLLKIDNIPRAALEFLSVPPGSISTECRQALRKTKMCFDSTFDRLFRFNRRELCRRIVYHGFCSKHTKSEIICNLDTVSILAKADATLRNVMEEIWCTHNDRFMRDQRRSKAVRVAFQSIVDYMAMQHSMLQFAIAMVNCAVDPTLCSH